MALDRFRLHKSSADYTYISLVGALILFGLVMISSSSVVLSVEKYGSNYSFVIKQAISLFIGFFAAIIASRVDYKIYKQYAAPMLGISLLLMLIVFIPGLGKSANGASRWIDIGPFQLQPSEILKLSMIIYLSAWIEQRGAQIKTFSNGLIPFLVLVGGVGLLVIAQRDMGTTSVIVFTSALMFVVAGATVPQMTFGVTIGALALTLLIAIAPYRLARLTTFLNPSADTLGAGYHINQSLLAIGSGGLWGRGFGQSLQKYLYLPEPHTDSIFAITVEELGFFRASIVIVLIGLLAYRGFQIATRAGDGFGRLLAFGITSWFLFQAIMNLGSIMGLMPLTGLPLPFVSYGGTSLILSLVAVGIMVNISKQSYGR